MVSISTRYEGKSNSMLNVHLVSDYDENWDAGAASVMLNLERELSVSGEVATTLWHPRHFMPAKLGNFLTKLSGAFLLRRRIRQLGTCPDVLEIIGRFAWPSFRYFKRQGPGKKRPLLICRFHGLSLKDDQARMNEEDWGFTRLPWKYKFLSRHWIHWMERKSIQWADIVVCHSSRDADAIISSGLKDEAHVRVMPLGFENHYLERRRLFPQETRLLWWGSWIERKGISALPRAFELISRELPTAQLSIGGTGRSSEQILSHFKPELHARIKVLPFLSREQHKDALLNHEVFLFPSLSEGFGIALLEALATGMPSITTLTGMYDWLEHGHNCLIVPMSAPSRIAESVVRLANSRELREKLSAGAFETSKNLSWQAFGKASLALYKNEKLSDWK